MVRGKPDTIGCECPLAPEKLLALFEPIQGSSKPLYLGMSNFLKRGTPRLGYGLDAPVDEDPGGMEDGGNCRSGGRVGMGDGKWGKLILWIGRGTSGVVAVAVVGWHGSGGGHWSRQ